MRRTERIGERREPRTLMQASLLGLALFVNAGTTQAQQLPTPSEPWQIERQRDLLRPPQSTPEPVVPQIPSEAIAPKDAADIHFTLEQVIILDATVYRDDELSPFYVGSVGQTVSLTDVYAIANAITAKYRNEGYVLTRAIVPPQRIEGGRVTIRIVEGFVETVIVEGGPQHLRRVVEGYADKIKRSRPLHVSTLERYMLLIRDLPGVRADSVLRAAHETPGASHLVVRLDYEPVEASLNADNRGSKFLGRVQITPMVRLNTFFGTGNQTSLRYVRSGINNGDDPGKLNYFEIRNRQVIGSEGTAVTVGYSRVRSRPGFTLSDFDVRNRGERAIANITHPIIRSRRQSLFASVVFEMKNAETDFLDGLLSEDRIRTIGANIAYDFVDRFKGTTLVEFGFTQGLDILSSSKGSATPSRAGGEADFFKLNATVTRVQRLADNFNLLVALVGQYTEDNMLSPEEFSVGGGVIGRGYDFGEITGDRGFGGKIELQYDGVPDSRYFGDYQLYGFFDFGVAYEVGSGDRERLTSAGAGVRFSLIKKVSGFFEIAKPINRAVTARDPEDGKDVRFLFGFQVRN